MSRIAVFGGSFDPPHIGHMLNIKNVLNSGTVDQVWVVPADDGRYDKPTRATARHRKEMTEISLAQFFPGEGRVSLNSIQLNKELTGAYTIDLLDELEKCHPENEFWFVIGTENLEGISTWKSAERLKTEKKFLAVKRPGTDMVDPIPKFVTLVGKDSDEFADIASTRIRDAVKSGNSIDGLVCSKVRDYIFSQGLYR